MVTSPPEKVFKTFDNGYLKVGTLVHFDSTDKQIDLCGECPTRLNQILQAIASEYFPNQIQFNNILVTNQEGVVGTLEYITQDKTLHFQLFSTELDVQQAENILPNQNLPYKFNYDQYKPLLWENVGATLFSGVIPPSSVFGLPYYGIFPKDSKDTKTFDVSLIKSLLFFDSSVQIPKQESSRDPISKNIWGNDLWQEYALLVRSLAKGEMDLFTKSYLPFRVETSGPWEMEVYNPTTKRMNRSFKLLKELQQHTYQNSDQITRLLFGFKKENRKINPNEDRQTQINQEFSKVPTFQHAEELSNLIF